MITAAFTDGKALFCLIPSNRHNGMYVVRAEPQGMELIVSQECPALKYKASCTLGKHRRYYLSLNPDKQTFMCWYCMESGGVLRFVSLLTGTPEELLLHQYRKRRLDYPTEGLTQRQLHFLGQSYGNATDPYWYQAGRYSFDRIYNEEDHSDHDDGSRCYANGSTLSSQFDVGSDSVVEKDSSDYFTKVEPEGINVNTSNVYEQVGTKLICNFLGLREPVFVIVDDHGFESELGIVLTIILPNE